MSQVRGTTAGLSGSCARKDGRRKWKLLSDGGQGKPSKPGGTAFVKRPSRNGQKNLFVLLLVTILSQAFFTLVGRNLMTFSFFTARHLNSVWLMNNLFSQFTDSFFQFFFGLGNRHLLLYFFVVKDGIGFVSFQVITLGQVKEDFQVLRVFLLDQ